MKTLGQFVGHVFKTFSPSDEVSELGKLKNLQSLDNWTYLINGTQSPIPLEKKWSTRRWERIILPSIGSVGGQW